MRVRLRMSGARAGLAGRADDLRIHAAEPPRLQSMRATEDFITVIVIPIPLRICAAETLELPLGRRRGKGIAEECEVRSCGEGPGLCSGVPAAAGRLDPILDVKGLTSKRNTTIGERVRLHAGQNKFGHLTKRHLACLSYCLGEKG